MTIDFRFSGLCLEIPVCSVRNVHMKLRADQSSLLGATALALALQWVPILRPLSLPFIYLNTHLHELMHAIATVLTGGMAGRIEVYADGSGVTLSAGGFMPIIASAGYMGSMLAGTGLLMASRTPEAARKAIGALVAVMAVGSLLWLRGDLVGLLTALAWLAALTVILKRADAGAVRWTGQFVGLLLVLASWDAFRVLFAVSQTGSHSDAMSMQMSTGIPAVFWAGFWALLSVAATIWGLIQAWKSPQSVRKS